MVLILWDKSLNSLTEVKSGPIGSTAFRSIPFWVQFVFSGSHPHGYRHGGYWWIVAVEAIENTFCSADHSVSF